MGKDNKVARFTPSDGLRVCQFRRLGFQRNFGCMQEFWFTGMKMRAERLESHVVGQAYALALSEGSCLAHFQYVWPLKIRLLEKNSMF